LGSPPDSPGRGWSVVRQATSTLSLPAFLDIDPSAALGGNPDRSAPLYVLRRTKTAED
jgi:hypothetical protein